LAQGSAAARTGRVLEADAGPLTKNVAPKVTADSAATPNERSPRRPFPLALSCRNMNRLLVVSNGLQFHLPELPRSV
jgi:hypothetical protein